MMKFSITAVMLVILLPLTACKAADNDDCAYSFQDAATYKAPYQKRVKEGDLKTFKWDDKNHVATAITRGGDKVTVTYYACFALGVDAELRTSSDQQEAISKKLLWLTRLALDCKQEVDKVRKEILKAKFTSHFKNGAFAGDRIYGFIPNAGYLNIEYSVDKDGKDMEIEVTSSID